MTSLTPALASQPSQTIWKIQGRRRNVRCVLGDFSIWIRERFMDKKEGQKALPLVNRRTVINHGYNKTADGKLVCIEINPVKERGAETFPNARFGYE